ncbi:hypothetical protein P152DRAFT_374730, partial [Eremomyces bilateralis CBS 781.70]
LVASNLVFHNNTLLVVQRSENDFYAGRWEYPGGSVDDSDRSILAGAARELYEETGLHTTGFVREVGAGMNFTTGKGPKTTNWLKMSFEVDVAALPVQLDPVEHQDYCWVTEAEIRERRVGGMSLTFISEEARATMLEGFTLR